GLSGSQQALAATLAAVAYGHRSAPARPAAAPMASARTAPAVSWTCGSVLDSTRAPARTMTTSTANRRAALSPLVIPRAIHSAMSADATQRISRGVDPGGITAQPPEPLANRRTAAIPPPSP